MAVVVDISEVEETTERAHDAFEEMPNVVLGFVEAGADILVTTDPYQDHSGSAGLRANTRAVNIDDDPNSWEFDLEMDKEYASFVNDLGFSRIDEVGEEGGVVDKLIESFLEDEMANEIIG